ncbi:MAG: 30S ribosome-binding factor RbfA [Chloroflexi bacterium]|nr:30S ribosome-binding factor RbfA [Chloroflexota bacterium]
MPGRRNVRVADLLREELSLLVQRQVKDPRVGGLVTITQVEPSPDLRHARVFVSVLASQDERRAVLVGLQAASGFLQHELRQRLDLKRIPSLSFYPDESLERGAHLLEVMRRLEGEREGDARDPDGR